ILIAFSICSYILAQGGNSFETAVQATFDTNNVAYASEEIQFYYFTPDFNGYVAIGNCGLTNFDTEVWVYDSLGIPVGSNDDDCNYQSHLVIPVDSSMRYYVGWVLLQGTAKGTYNWYLTQVQPKPGEICLYPISAIEGVNHVNLPGKGTQWFEYSVATEAKVLISVNPETAEKIGNWDIQFSYDCAYREKDIIQIDDTSFAFIADSAGGYKILFNHYELGDTTEFDWILREEEILPGERCSEPIHADTGMNTFYSGRMPGLFYSFQIPDEGKIIIDFCNSPEDANVNCQVYTGNCDNMTYINDLNEYYCESGINNRYSFYTDSGENYFIVVNSKHNEDFKWEIILTEPYPGEFYQSAIPVELNDTIELSSINNSGKTWYKFEADKNKMITISTCGFGNGPWDIFSISVHKDSLLTYDYWFMYIYKDNCTDGKRIEFPADTGSVYYIELSHLNELKSAKWAINERDFESGEICDSSVLVNKGVVYKIPSEKGYYWYKYTPVENEYKVIGGIGSEEQYAGLFIKEDCNCEPEYGATSGCIACDQHDGIVLLLEAAKTYHIGWQNFNFQEYT
ncbi:MAG: hypothetical protein JW702_07100, partial [Clostridiales bacterium]|nr:hypothetical protein [Clostridiales bacterium]